MNIQAYRPRYCVWEFTLACNLRCGHCGSSAGQARPDELTTAECLDVVRQLADLDCRLITLSGGEPTLRPDWEDVAREAVRLGITVNMVSNGTTLTADMAQRIADAGLANVAVSLDGTPETHEAVRGAGTFHRVSRAMRYLARANVPTAMITHLNKDTLFELEEIHDIALELGARSWRVQLGKPMGNLHAQNAKLLQPEDLMDLMPRLAWLKKTSPLWVDIGDSIGYYGPYEKQLREKAWGNMRPVWTGCQAGRVAVGIESDGGVKGCLSLQSRLNNAGDKDPFREGDLRSRRLADIWFDPQAFAYNRHQKASDLTGACRSCRHAKICRGGAKCVAAAFTGTVSHNPFCFHQVQQIKARKSRRVLGSLRNTAAAAMLSVGLGFGGAALSGCDERGAGTYNDNHTLTPDASVTLVSDASIGDDALVLDPDAEPCCHYEYGELPPPDATVEPDADPCEGVCCDCDYGIPPPGCCD